MEVVPLRSRSPRELAPALIAAAVLGAAVAALALAVVLGDGAEPGWTVPLLVVAIAALLPAIVVAREARVFARPAELTVGDDGMTISYPERLRAPLTVPRYAVRSALVGDVTAVFQGRYTPLPQLTPEGATPNVAIVFHTPVQGADVRRAPLGAIFRREEIPGLVLSVADVPAAERALEPWIRGLVRYDGLVLEWNLAESGRHRRETRRVLFWGAVILVLLAHAVWMGAALL
jgi:hypothetical protein